jgi:Methylamine utilisation protein MauE
VETIALIGRVILVVTVGGAGLSKIGDRVRLTEAIMGYRVVPDRIAVALGRWLPIAEMVAAALLAVGVGVVVVAVFVAVSLTVFAGAMVVNLIRGRRIECGCSGGSVRRISWLLVARNLLLATVAGMVATISLGSVPTAIATLPGLTSEKVAVILITCSGLLGAALARRTQQLRRHAGALREPASLMERI